MPTLLGFLLAMILGFVGAAEGNSAREIGDFNQNFVKLILNSDHAGMLALWADDGVDLMPGESPMVGKTTIANWLKAIESTSRGSKVIKEVLEFHDIRISGDWATEWATEHQIVQSPGKPAVEGSGKIALVLHRDERGQWSIQQEMWNDSPHP